jgi:proteasome alpha subunit
MSMPIYVSAEQLMKDRADYARKNIARGRLVVVLGYEGGIAFITENPSRALHKVSEIYDRIAFAAVGKYNEFENLRVAGVRYADLRGYSYDRTDVTARGLANAYAQTLGAVFTQEPKPLEVELAVAEVGLTQDRDQIFRLTFDGSVAEEAGFVAMGAQGEQGTSVLQERWQPGMSLSAVLSLAVELITRDPAGGQPRALASSQLEVAILDRLRPRRAFRRLAGPLLERLLASDDPTTDVPHTDDPRPGMHDLLTGDAANSAADRPSEPDSEPRPASGGGPDDPGDAGDAGQSGGGETAPQAGPDQP